MKGPLILLSWLRKTGTAPAYEIFVSSEEDPVLGSFLIVFSVFTADVVDLREDLHILSNPSGCLDDNIEAGVACSFSIVPEHLSQGFGITKKASVKISFLHLLPYAFRAPPSLF